MSVNQSISFQTSTAKIAEEFVLDVEAVSAAYGSKPETLNTLFNSLSRAQKNLTLHKVAAIGCGLLAVATAVTVVVPVISGTVAVYSGLQWRNKNQKIASIGAIVNEQITAYKDACSSTNLAPAPQGV